MIHVTQCKLEDLLIGDQFWLTSKIGCQLESTKMEVVFDAKNSIKNNDNRSVKLVSKDVQMQYPNSLKVFKIVA